MSNESTKIPSNCVHVNNTHLHIVFLVPVTLYLLTIIRNSNGKYGSLKGAISYAFIWGRGFSCFWPLPSPGNI